jgi:bla regulator protein blaR1
MITYLIKSTISLVLLYGFFHFFLRQHKILIFNRIYLMCSLEFSLIIPLINIPVKSGFPINTALNSLTVTTSQIIQSQENIIHPTPSITFETILVIFFLLISFVLFVRFTYNIFNLIKKIIRCKKVENQHITLVLVKENIIPYSFFRYIFVNKKSYEEGKIERELLLHEEAHCQQYHSIDVLILELINVFLWFNPAIWLFRKSIQLNHEYYADNSVLKSSDAEDYHQLLINLVIQNDTSYLVSNFKYSLIKNRIIMMSKNSPSNYAILRKIIAISFSLFLGIAFTFSQGNKSNNDPSSLTSNPLNQQGKASDDWWKPIVKKHGIKFESYTIHENFLIIGEKTLTDNLETYKNSIAIQNANKSYWIFKFKSATYNNLSKQLNIYGCAMEKFNMNPESKEPLSSYKNITYKINFITKREMMADTIPY